MSTINFNLKNKDESQIKNEILSKMSKIRQNYDNDNSYHELFYNVVANSNKKNNLKLSINKEGVYNLKVGAGNSNKNATGLLKGLGSLFGFNNTVQGTASVKPTEEESVSREDESEKGVSEESVSGEDESEESVSGEKLMKVSDIENIDLRNYIIS